MIINFKRTNILGNENVPNMTTYDDLKIALDNTAGGAENPLGYSYIQILIINQVIYVVGMIWILYKVNVII